MSGRRGKGTTPAQADRIRDMVRALIADRFDGSQTRAAKALGVSTPTMSDLLNGNRGPGLQLLDGLRRVTGLSLDAIVYGEPEPLASPPAAPAPADPAPIPMLLWCPACHARHVDKGRFATKPHRDHSCQACGLTWRPALVPTVGVQFLPGYKDEIDPAADAARDERGAP